MFSSINLKDFGLELRRIRKSSRLTQTKVKDMTGLNEDTLRRIEKGLVIAKYETLELLSVAYKTDLLALLKQFRTNQELYTFYRYFDRLIISNQIKDNPTIKNELKMLLEMHANGSYVNSSEFDLLKVMVQETINYFDENYSDHEASVKILTENLKLSIEDFVLANFSAYTYSHLETRVLLLICLLLIKANQLRFSTDIMLFCLEHISDVQFISDECHKIKIKLFLNISYNLYILDSYEASLAYANKGIAYANQISSSYCLPHLIARKAAAEYHFDPESATKSFKDAINLFKILDQTALADSYIEIVKNRYHLNIT